MGTVAGRYELRNLLGRGERGVVHRAVDRELGREVAVKVLPLGSRWDAASRFRLKRNAPVLIALRHPAIAAVYDLGVDDTGSEPFSYLVTEYVRGRDLREVVRERVLTVRQAVWVAAEVLDALRFAHAQGVLHEAIGPSHVMVTGPVAGAAGARDGVKVLGFEGRLLGPASTEPVPTVSALTCLAPERLRWVAPGDPRSDLYSVGCLLYQLLTGRSPFPGDSALAVLQRLLRETPAPPAALRPDVPRAVSDVVLAALAKEPGDRYADAEAMRSALMEALRLGR